jgi:Eukaryotic integral membrane protein (DUF1751)
MALSIVILPISLRYVERLWGAVETTKFVLITVGVSNIIAVFVNIIEHIAIGQDGYFLCVPLTFGSLSVVVIIAEFCFSISLSNSRPSFGMAYNGLMALQVGVLVALTQAIPEHQILLFGTLGVRMKVISVVAPLCYPFELTFGCFYRDNPPVTGHMTIAIPAASNALCDILQHYVHSGLPVTVYSHPIWVACLMGIPSIL